MKKLKNYIIGHKSEMIVPEFNEIGKLCAKIIEGNNIYLVEQSPKAIIEKSLLCYGSDFQGSVKSSKSILGNVCMPPIAICPALDLYWFPSASPYRNDCVWISLAHFQDVKKVNDQKSKVIFKNGFSLCLDISVQSILSRRSLALLLRYEMEQHLKSQMSVLYKSRNGFTLIKQPEELKYVIRISEN
ncbi:competence protein ComK [Cytobacillus sp. Hz8]|uniref:competence protein ComK n=1 Tax=Cytobacillus sp. Hz8 TaxID=3347168 RepID=UPI0035D5AB50